MIEFFFFSSRRRHTRFDCDWSSDVCSSDLVFQLDGQEFIALNGEPQFKCSQAVSFVVNCNTQKEVDELWEKLSAGGEQQVCGWLKDKFGLSWQIVPSALPELLSDPDPAISQSVMKAMMQMKKLDIEGLKRAKQAATK